MKIQNYGALAVSDARRDLLTIAEAGLQAIDTRVVMKNVMRVESDMLFLGEARADVVGAHGAEKIDLAATGKIIFIAIGKCAAEATAVAESVLGSRIARGVVVDVKPCAAALPQIKTFVGTHPLPSDVNEQAAEAIVAALSGLAENDLVIFVTSGGGSTLLFLPQDRADRSEIGVFTALTKAGANIHEMNIVRKHLSLARGGHLAERAYPARVVSLIFSDVIGDDLTSIASGPTVKDASTIADAEGILAKYGVAGAGADVGGVQKFGLIETPKDDKYFARVTNLLAVSNVFALHAMRDAAVKLGYQAEIRGAALEGEAADVAQMIANELHAAPAKTALLWGGETTVTVRGNGTGGRNITVCASALSSIKEGEEILSLASDGHDHGPYAGALCDTITKKAAVDAGVGKYLANNDTYPLFEKIGNYLTTGDTGSNVSDLIIALKE